MSKKENKATKNNANGPQEEEPYIEDQQPEETKNESLRKPKEEKVVDGPPVSRLVTDMFRAVAIEESDIERLRQGLA